MPSYFLIKKKKYFINLYELIFQILLIIGFNNDWRLISSVWYGLVIVSFLCFACRYRTITIKEYEKWLLFFMIWGSFSLLWSIEKNNTLQFIYSSISRLLILIPFHQHLCVSYERTEERVKRVIELFSFALFVNAIYILVILDWNAIIAGGTLGVYTLTKEWPANETGARYGIGAFLLLYYAFKNKKPLSIIASIPFIAIMALSGSKGAILLFVVPLVLYIILSSKNPIKTVRNVIVSVFIMYIAIRICFEVEIVYQLVGRRFENLFLGLTGSANLESTTKVREMMIRYGMQWFWNSPLWGYGMRCYSTLMGGVYSHAVYSHNTYIEILVGAGIIGFCIYYYLYFSILKKAVLRKYTLKPLAMGLMLSILIHDYSAIDYNDLAIQICILISYICVESNTTSQTND